MILQQRLCADFLRRWEHERRVRCPDSFLSRTGRIMHHTCGDGEAFNIAWISRSLTGSCTLPQTYRMRVMIGFKDRHPAGRQQNRPYTRLLLQR